MSLGFYVAGASGQLMQKTINSITNNLANVNTIGYRAARSNFSTFFSGQAAPGGRAERPSAAFLIAGKQSVDLREGALASTGNPLDLALHGDGYFRIRLDDGSEALTRAGNFQLNAGGNLVTTGGKAVLDDGGSPINLPMGALTVLEDGSMLVNGAGAGRIGVVRIIDPRNIRKMAGVLLTTPPGNVKPAGNDVRVMQGVTESSNVNAVQEMVRMMSVQRTFQSMMKIMTQYDRQMSLLNEQVGRIQ